MKSKGFFAPRVRPAKRIDRAFAERLTTGCRRSFGERAAAVKIFFALALFAACAASPAFVGAQTPGSLDATFGAGGRVTTAIGAASEGISGVAIQADGKIVAAGYSSNGANTDFALARYNADGTLDATFGAGGKVTTAIGTRNDFAASVAVQSNGRIVVAGYAETGTNTDFAVARYNVDGTLDATFGTGGKVTTAIGALDDFASAVLVQADGKIVVAGATETSIFSNDFVVARYNADGTPDATFGTNGRTVTPVGAADDFASAAALQPDGKIVVAGASSDGATDNFAAVRYNANGSLDTTFGSGGRVTTPVGSGDDFASAVVIQSDGKIVVAGDSNTGGNNDFALVRYNANGSLDTTFGTGGKTVAAIGSANDYLYAAAIQANGAIVTAGFASGTNDDFAVARFTAAGALDTTFGTGGRTITAFGTADDYATAIAIQADGKIVAGGATNNGTNLDFALARYFGTAANNPVPAITALSPNNRLVGSTAFEITITGSNFVAGSIVRFNGQDRQTTFVSDTQLRAQITAADLQTAGQFPVTVFNPAPGGGTSNALTFSVAACAYSITPTAQTFTNAGGSSSFTVTTQTGCAYTAASNSPFISITGGASGSGNGTVTFTVAANTGAARTGTITVGGQTFTVNQEGACSYTLSASGSSVAAAGGNGSFTVTTGNGCAFAATTNASFITITSGTGTGSGAVTFTVAANTGAERTGTITVGGQTYTITQASGCTYSIAPASGTFGSNGGTGSFTVTTGTGCAYTATSSAPFITVNNGTGTGNGTVTFTVAANTGADRTGTITVAGQTYTVNQSGGCAYTLNPTTANFGNSGGTGSFAVTTGAGCTFTATTNSPFITINNGTGTGSGTVTFTVAANTGTDRTGTITVNGQTLTVAQTGGCTFAVAPTSLNFAASGGTGSFDVTSGTGCAFAATSSVSWIVVNTGATGSGNGTVTFTVQANTAPTARTGTITAGGQTLTINQAAAGTNAPRTAFDFDGDGKADVSVFRPDTGIWYLLNSTSGFGGVQFGAANDRLVPADYDGDGKTDVAVYRDGTWYLQRSTAGFAGVGFGAATDIPTPADFDGDGRAELAVYRPSNGTWYTFNLTTNQSGGVAFGAAEDRPVAGDYDGDGKADVAVFRPSTGIWYLQRSSLGFTGLQFGVSTDKTVPADYDADGKTDIAVFRDGTWYLQRSTAGFIGIQFGLGTDLPTPGDYDGDGRADVAVYRSGTWYLQRTTAGFTGVGFGAATDRPAPNAFVR